MELKRFICNFNKYEKEPAFPKGIIKIKANAFNNDITVELAQFDVSLSIIESNAFENCQNLEIFVIGENFPEEIVSHGDSTISSDNKKVLEIQKEAFKNCNKLHTIILGSANIVTIEKDAFAGCESLRTVVCRTNDISFTNNPFSDCPNYLTFVGKKDSNLEKFARENGYRFIDD